MNAEQLYRIKRDRECLRRARMVFRWSEREPEIVLYPGHSTFATIDLEIMRHALDERCECDWYETGVGWNDDCPLLKERA